MSSLKINYGILLLLFLFISIIILSIPFWNSGRYEKIDSYSLPNEKMGEINKLIYPEASNLHVLNFAEGLQVGGTYVIFDMPHHSSDKVINFYKEKGFLGHEDRFSFKSGVSPDFFKFFKFNYNDRVIFLKKDLTKIYINKENSQCFIQDDF